MRRQQQIRAAIIIQRNWYRYLGRVATFVLVNALRVQETYALQVRTAMRRINEKAQAVRIATVFANIIRHYRESAAVKLQVLCEPTKPCPQCCC